MKSRRLLTRACLLILILSGCAAPPSQERAAPTSTLTSTPRPAPTQTTSAPTPAAQITLPPDQPAVKVAAPNYGPGQIEATGYASATFRPVVTTTEVTDLTQGVGHSSTGPQPPQPDDVHVVAEDEPDILPPSAIANLSAQPGPHSGAVDLSWTAPGEDGSRGRGTVYRVRYARAAIETETGWLNATPVSGEPAPQTAGAAEGMTISGLIPGQIYYFAIRAEDEAGNLTPLSSTPRATAKEAPDLGFRPDRDGYAFKNPGGESLTTFNLTCDHFAQSLDQIEVHCHNGKPQEEYLRLFRRFQGSFSTGICFGMASTSLAYFADSSLQPPATYNLSATEAWPNIAIHHGRQVSEGIFKARYPEWKAWTADAATISRQVDELYSEITEALEMGIPVLLDLYPREGFETYAHTVIPYRVDDSDPLRPRVYVYDSFHPGDSSRYVQFDLSGSRHRFDYWLWDSDVDSAGWILPLSVVMSPRGRTPRSDLLFVTSGGVSPVE